LRINEKLWMNFARKANVRSFPSVTWYCSIITHFDVRENNVQCVYLGRFCHKTHKWVNLWHSGPFFSLCTMLMKGNSLYNIDVIKLSPNSTQGIHNGCVTRCHVSCLTLRDRNWLYFVFRFGWFR
jgi:hypothetical protein